MLEAQREERVKDRFFQNVNNKIRHPLDTIVNLNQKLNVDDASSLSAMDKAHMMEELVNTGAYLTLLVNEVLDISKMESGTYKLRLEEVDVHSLCKSVLKEASAQLASGVELRFECRSVDGGDEATTCKLTTDLQRLQFVLLSYLNNACQHTLDGSVTLSYEVYPQRIVFAVTDTGLGLTQNEMDTIFIRDQLGMDGEGVGLSLHIVKLIADLLHGDASVDRTYKKGARFLFVHPIVRSKSE
jgi:signal transduction histidine kinase